MARIEESSVVGLLRGGVLLVLLCLFSSCESPQITALRTVPPIGTCKGGETMQIEALFTPAHAPVTFAWAAKAGKIEWIKPDSNTATYHCPSQAGTDRVTVTMFHRGKQVAEKTMSVQVEAPASSKPPPQEQASGAPTSDPRGCSSSVLRDGDSDFEAFSLSWHRWKGHPSFSQGVLCLVGPADIQTNDNYQSQDLTVTAQAQWAPDTSIGFELWDRDMRYSIRVSRGKLIVETSGVGSHEAPIPNWPALRMTPLTFKMSWSDRQVKLHIDNQPTLDYTGLEVPTRPLKVRLNAASGDTLTVTQITLEDMKPRKDSTVPSITILDDIRDIKNDPIQKNDAPFKCYVKGVVSNVKDFYVYLVVNDFHAEWIQPTSGLGKNVGKNFSGYCHLGIEKGDSGSLNKLYEISAVVTDRAYKEYDHLDRKTIKAESNKIQLYRIR